jgi:hypothetical protein
MVRTGYHDCVVLPHLPISTNPRTRLCGPARLWIARCSLTGLTKVSQQTASISSALFCCGLLIGEASLKDAIRDSFIRNFSGRVALAQIILAQLG